MLSEVEAHETAAGFPLLPLMQIQTAEIQDASFLSMTTHAHFVILNGGFRSEEMERNGLGRKLNKGELEDLTERAAVLVKFIDDYDDKDGEHSEEETAVYYSKYAEWIKLNKQIWHYKVIARNQIAYTLTKMMERLEKGLQKTPDNYLLR